MSEDCLNPAKIRVNLAYTESFSFSLTENVISLRCRDKQVNALGVNS
jgi:hypothetical protein